MTRPTSFAAWPQVPASHWPSNVTMKTTVETTVMRSIVVRLSNDANSGKHFVHIEAFHSGFLVFCTDDTEQQNEEENDSYITLNNNKNKMAKRGQFEV